MIESIREEAIQDMDLVLQWEESSDAGSRRSERADTEVGKGLVLMQEAVLTGAQRREEQSLSASCRDVLSLQECCHIKMLNLNKTLNRIVICIYFLCIGTYLSE